MKKLFLTLSFAVFSLWLFGQNENPFSQFGYEAPIMKSACEKYAEKIEFLVTNEDTSSLVAYLVIDTEQKLIKFYSDESQTMFVDTILSYDMARWLSPDPAYQHNSPYLAMSNNSVSYVDPDGALDLGPFGYFNSFSDYYIHFAGLNFRNLGGGFQFWSEGLNINSTYKIVANVNYNHLQNIPLIVGRTFSTTTVYDNGKQYERTSFQNTIHLNGSGAAKYRNFSHIQGVQFTMSPNVTVSNQRGKEIFQSSIGNQSTEMLANKNYYLNTSGTINPINREITSPQLDPNNAEIALDEVHVYAAAGKRYSKTLRIKATPAFFEEIQKAGIATVF